MPLLAPRRWLVPQTSSAPNALLSRFAVAHAKAKGKRSIVNRPPPQIQPSPFAAATIIPHSVNQDERTLLSHVRSVGQHRAKEKLCVILVTPSFASKLLDDGFMGKFLYRVFNKTIVKLKAKSIFNMRIEALCAVVDKLPVGRPLTALDNLYSEGEARDYELPVAATGFEGFAYVSLPAAYSAPSNLHLPPVSTCPGAIDFVTSAGRPNSSEHGKALPDYEVLRLPLANTIFQTGTATTMFRLCYETQATGPVLHKVSREKLSHYQVRVNAHLEGRKIKNGIPGLVTSLSIPLLPLTMPRHVSGCMGNIIRRIIDSKGDEVTASSELEEVVPKFFQARGEPAQATTAWALVVPSQLKPLVSSSTKYWLDRNGDVGADYQWESLWKSDPPVWSNAVADAIARGARLHRVLSGGGGWGEKAGLLSLDPAPVTVPSETSGTEELPSTPADPEDFASTLTPVINDGDLIQFFIQPWSHLSAEAARYDTEEQIKAIPEDRAVGWELGTVPSTADSIPGRSWQHAEPVSSGASIFKHSFGALTEGPLTLTKRILKGALVDTSVTTTIDVPFARFWKLDIERPKTPKKSRDKNKLKAVSTALKQLDNETTGFQREDRQNVDEDGAPQDVGERRTAN